MATETVTALDELTSPAANDEIGIWDVSAAQYMRITRANLVGGTITGGGTVATGGYTLTVPATGTAALLAVANTFTASQRFEGAAGTAQLVVNAPSGHTGPMCAIGFNASYGLNHYQSASVLATIWSSLNVGNNVAGPYLQVGRNSNSSTEGGAPGAIGLTQANGSAIRYIWSDNSGNLRIHNAQPTGSTGSPTVNGESAGTVVGTQTSMAAAKHLADDLTPIGEVLASIQQAATAGVRRFSYRSGAFNGEAFEGVVTDLAPRYGMDRDEEHPAGKSLNEITLLGDLLRAVAHLAERVAALEK